MPATGPLARGDPHPVEPLGRPPPPGPPAHPPAAVGPGCGGPPHRPDADPEAGDLMRAITLDIEAPVARITLNRPEVLNAGDAGWVAEMGDAVARVAAAGERLRVAVVTGAGRAFSTGVDLKALAAGAMTLPHFVAWEESMTAIERMSLPFVAAINGHCLGGGLQLALVFDYRIASAEASIGLPTVKECLIPSMALYRLPRLIGAARAAELVITGEPISATRAEEYGLVHRVVPQVD